MEKISPSQCKVFPSMARELHSVWALRHSGLHRFLLSFSQENRKVAMGLLGPPTKFTTLSPKHVAERVC
jgi:hypothetical protein